MLTLIALTVAAKEWQKDFHKALKSAVQGNDTDALRNPDAVDAIEARHLFLSHLAADVSAKTPTMFGSTVFEVQHADPENSPLEVPAQVLLQVNQVFVGGT